MRQTRRETETKEGHKEQKKRRTEIETDKERDMRHMELDKDLLRQGGRLTDIQRQKNRKKIKKDKQAPKPANGDIRTVLQTHK